MNAYIMAAGCGMRLRPMTDDFQKCLLPVGGKPMLEWWLDAVFSNPKIFDKVFVNVHHCARAVEGWLASYTIRRGYFPRVIDESNGLLGTAGTLYWYGEDQEDFMVAYADTFSEDIFFKNGINRLHSSWLKLPKYVEAGLAYFSTPGDGSGGALQFDKNMNVKKFEEKSDDGDVAWAGVMFARKSFYLMIENGDKDLARDVFPKAMEKIRVIGQIDAFDMGRGIGDYYELDKRIREAQSY